ncbi:MAG: hypothetical protein ACYCTV_02540 [Leptospirales bacterium]
MEIRLSGRLSLRSGKTSGHPLCEVRDRVRGFDDGFYLFDPKTLRILEANSLFSGRPGREKIHLFFSGHTGPDSADGERNPENGRP